MRSIFPRIRHCSGECTEWEGNSSSGLLKTFRSHGVVLSFVELNRKSFQFVLKLFVLHCSDGQPVELQRRPDARSLQHDGRQQRWRRVLRRTHQGLRRQARPVSPPRPVTPSNA